MAMIENVFRETCIADILAEPVEVNRKYVGAACRFVGLQNRQLTLPKYLSSQATTSLTRSARFSDTSCEVSNMTTFLSAAGVPSIRSSASLPRKIQSNLPAIISVGAFTCGAKSA